MGDAAYGDRAGAHPISRLERFGSVDSTQRVVRDWLAAGEPEVCVAVADRQTEGRGRLDRVWQDESGRSLLVSAGFRPAALSMASAWHLPAAAALAMLEAIRATLGPGASQVTLKWPNDIVAMDGGSVRKLAGVLAEGVPEGDRLSTAVVGIGLNVDWPAEGFPEDLAGTMSSLRELAGGRPVEREAVLGAWLAGLGSWYGSLSDGRFDTEAWAAAQVTTGCHVEVETATETVTGLATGVDEASGALVLRTVDGVDRAIPSGDVRRCRIEGQAGVL